MLPISITESNTCLFVFFLSMSSAHPVQASVTPHLNNCSFVTVYLAFGSPGPHSFGSFIVFISYITLFFSFSPAVFLLEELLPAYARDIM